MEDVGISIIVLVSLSVGAYLFGRLFAKGFFKEVDMLLGKKFTEYMNNKQKQKENGNKEEK
jgi:hypothetical protein